MKIGNIVIDKPIRVDKNINVVDSFDKIIEGIPTLIVGIQNIKEIEPNLDYLNRKVSEKLFWTFTKQEKRLLFEEDLYYFTEMIYNEIIKKIKYQFIDLILLNSDEVTLMFDEINKIEKKITLFSRDMLYVYGDKTIFSFDLKQVRYIGKKKEMLINKVRGLSDVFLDSKDILIEYNNDLEMFNYEIKYIPLLYTIKNHE